MPLSEELKKLIAQGSIDSITPELLGNDANNWHDFINEAKVTYRLDIAQKILNLRLLVDNLENCTLDPKEHQRQMIRDDDYLLVRNSLAFGRELFAGSLIDLMPEGEACAMLTSCNNQGFRLAVENGYSELLHDLFEERLSYEELVKLSSNMAEDAKNLIKTKGDFSLLLFLSTTLKGEYRKKMLDNLLYGSNSSVPLAEYAKTADNIEDVICILGALSKKDDEIDGSDKAGILCAILRVATEEKDLNILTFCEDLLTEDEIADYQEIIGVTTKDILRLRGDLGKASKLAKDANLPVVVQSILLQISATNPAKAQYDRDTNYNDQRKEIKFATANQIRIIPNNEQNHEEMAHGEEASATVIPAASLQPSDSKPKSILKSANLNGACSAK